jgi:hypothetical protein
MKTDHREIYAARNRSKKRCSFWTFDAAWNLAANVAKEKWGVESASLYVSTALCNQLHRDGKDIRKLIIYAKNYLIDKNKLAPMPVHT